MQREAIVYEGAVARLYDDFLNLQEFLKEKGAPHLLFALEDVFPKTMLLAAASYLERRLSTDVERIAVEAAADDHVLVWLVRSKVIERQYHTWFDWSERNVNANSFFRLFGKGFKQWAEELVRNDERLKESVADFLEIGRERNKLVHENFGNYTLEKTAKEVVALYNSAKLFVDWFPEAVRRYSAALNQG